MQGCCLQIDIYIYIYIYIHIFIFRMSWLFGLWQGSGVGLFGFGIVEFGWLQSDSALSEVMASLTGPSSKPYLQAGTRELVRLHRVLQGFVEPFYRGALGFCAGLRGMGSRGKFGVSACWSCCLLSVVLSI